MELLKGLDGLRQLPHGSVLSIGNFDGIHCGHQRILEIARDLRNQSGKPLCVVTFEPHPLTALRPAFAPPRLTPAMLKQALLADSGADYLVILPPEPAVLNTTAEDFWRILRDEIRVSHLVEGASFNFGKNRGGSTQLLVQWAAGTGVQVHVPEAVEVALLDLSIVKVNSSIIRWLLGHGRVRDAAICLGRPFVLEGKVIRGFERGRTLGMPTANLDCADQMLPADGVYAARTTLDGRTYPVAFSVGLMPTFGEGHRQIEGHIIGFDGDLYGQTVQFEILDWLRDQRKYPSVEPLKVQMASDLEQAKARLEMMPAQAIAVVGL